VSDLLNSETGWINLTNALLGIAVFICLIAATRALVIDLRTRFVQRHQKQEHKGRRKFSLESVGITLADGGESLNELSQSRKKDRDEPDDPQNIVRSDN